MKKATRVTMQEVGMEVGARSLLMEAAHTLAGVPVDELSPYAYVLLAVRSFLKQGLSKGAFLTVVESAFDNLVGAPPPEVAIGDVVQLDPVEGCDWGPMFAVVDKVYADGAIRCDMFIPQERGDPPAVAPIRMEPGKFVRIGKAAWVLAEAPSE